MPFSNEGGAVAAVLQVLAEEAQRVRRAALVVHHAVRVRVEAGQNRRATRRAERGRDERLRKVHSVIRQPIDSGCFQKRMPKATERIPSLVIDEENAGRMLGDTPF